MPRARLVAHVIVKSQDGEMPDRVFEEAGKLAAYYSKNRGNDKVEIDYIEKKHVKKVNGADRASSSITPTIRWSSTQTSPD